MILMAPTFPALQQLLQKTYNGLKAHCFKINFDKSKYIVFKKRVHVDLMDEIELNGCTIKRVEHIKYLDINLMDNSSIASDIDTCCDSFLRQFNGM